MKNSKITRGRLDAQGVSIVTLSLDTPVGLAKAVARCWFNIVDHQWHTSVVLPKSPEYCSGFPQSAFEDLSDIITQVLMEARALAKEREETHPANQAQSDCR